MASGAVDPLDAGPSQISNCTSIGTIGSRVKTVPQTRNLPELEQAAANHFKLNGRVRLYHKGRELHHPMNMADLPHGDTVVIKQDRSPRPFAATGERVVSTQQADFVRHALGSDTTPAPFNPKSVAQPQEVKSLLELQSSYTTDYQRPPAGIDVARPSPRKPVGNGFLGQHREAIGGSTYSAHYPWHEKSPSRNAVGSDSPLHPSTLTALSKGHRLDGTSSYKQDFAQNTPRGYIDTGPSAGASHGSDEKRNDYASTLTSMVASCPFEGTSSYVQHFVKHREGGRQLSAKPGPSSQMSSAPFEGKSEYRRQYEQRDARTKLLNICLE